MLTNSRHSNIYIKKFPLHNIVAEETIIGYLLSGKSLKKTLTKSINIHFFSLRKYQLLYFHIINTETKYEELNIIKIIHKLWSSNLLENIGGVNYIIYSIQKSQNLYISYNDYTHLKYLIKILHYYYIKRLFVQYSNSIIEIVYFYNVSLNKIYQLSIKSLNTISQIYNRHNPKNINNDIHNFLYYTHQPSKKNQNISSGFKDLDKITHGFKNGDLIIIAGRPSMGKTSFAINIIYHLSLNLNIKVHMFSLEMSKNEILHKLISLIANIKTIQIATSLIKKEDWPTLQKACKILMSSYISIDDNGHSSLSYITSQCKTHNTSRSVIIIDYLQLIKTQNENTNNRSQEIGNITRELKLLAQTLKCTVIILSQLNRNIENRANKRPLLSDLRESGCIDYINLPNIQSRSSTYFTETLHCFKQDYIFNRAKSLDLHENPEQYVFGIINYAKTILCTTHNHKAFTYNTWRKEDQFKYKLFYSMKPKSTLNFKLIIELDKIPFVKRFKKKKVYDLTLNNYHNFIIENYILHNSIEQDADLILMLYKNNDNIDDQVIDIVIAKHRHGPIGSFQLFFHADVCKFSNIQNQKLLDRLIISK